MLAALRLSQRIMFLPVGVFAVAIAVAIFPSLSAQAACSDMASFKRVSSLGLRSVLYIILPCAAFFMALKVPFIRLVFELSKNFTATDTIITADALFYYAIGLFAHAIMHVLSRMFYALQNTKTPVFAAVCSMAANIGLSLLLLKPMGHKGLALAYSLAAVFNVFLLVLFLRKRLNGLDRPGIIFEATLKMIFAASAAAFVMIVYANIAEALLGVESKIQQMIQLLTAAGSGAAIYIAITACFKMEEYAQIKQMIKERFFRRQKA
jgi:putative peptidoglycan lipid II flippase